MANLDNTPFVLQNIGGPPENLSVASGQSLSAGSVLGVISASGMLQLVDSSNSDGSESPEYVLLKDVDASAADVEVDKNAFLAVGKVYADKLIFGGSDTLSDHHLALKKSGIIAITADDLESYDN